MSVSDGKIKTNITTFNVLIYRLLSFLFGVALRANWKTRPSQTTLYIKWDFILKALIMIWSRKNSFFIRFHWKIAIICFVICLKSYSDKVGIFNSDIALNSSSSVQIDVPSGVVALSGNVPINGDSTAHKDDSTSLVFMVDNSGSMDDTDKNANRFKFIATVVDTLANNPNKYPGIECGLSVFGSNLYYHESNSPLLEYLPNDQNKSLGAFLPLVKLGKKYSNCGGKTGKEIIKELVETKLDWTGTTMLKSACHSNWMVNTNLDIGFSSAVESMKRSKKPKENQFIIYLGDGDGESSDCIDGFVNGTVDGIPTTFSIYFTEDGTAPLNIVNINDAIKRNGFSNSNSEYTNLKPYKNTTLDSLVSYVLDSIVSVFEAGLVIHPIKLTIGSESSALWLADSSYFTFAHPLALTSNKTTIPIGLDVKMIKDSIGANDSIHKVYSDTLFNLKPVVNVVDSLKEVDAKGKVYWWERELSLLEGNNALSFISQNSNNLKVLFEFDPMASGFVYSKAQISVKCIKSGDTLQLNGANQSDSSFLSVLNIDHVGKIDLSDNKIAPNSSDTLVFTFRNTEPYPFPLDTLQLKVPYSRFGDIYLKNATLLDENADGVLDKIKVELDGDTNVIKKSASEIATKIEFPASRGISIANTSIKGGVLSIKVNTAEGINTAANSDDSLVIKESVVISTGGILRKSSCSLVDSMAPVLTKATLFDNPLYEKDSLQVEYSEVVTQLNGDTLFTFYSVNNKMYCFALSSTLNNSKKQNVVIKDKLGHLISDGDSVNLRIDTVAADVLGNFQLSSVNKKVPIEIQRDIADLKIEQIVFLDPNGLGFPEEIKVSVNLVLTPDVKESFRKKIKSYIEGLSDRKLKVKSTIWGSKTCTFTTLLDDEELINTKVLETDKFINKNSIKLSNDVKINHIEIEPIDSMAPVLKSAICIDSLLSDTIFELKMVFSEIISEIDSFKNQSPFIFQKTSNLLPISLNYKEQKNDYFITVPYKKKERSFWDDVDSVRINSKFGITDGNTYQVAVLNRMVKLVHKKIASPILLEVNASLITPDDSLGYIVVSPQNGMTLQSGEKINGYLTIVDCVGNIVLKKQKLENTSNGNGIYKWDATNELGRKVSSGLYLVIVTVSSINQGLKSSEPTTTIQTSLPASLKTLIGVQK